MQSSSNNLRAVSNNLTLLGRQVMLKFGLIELVRKLGGRSEESLEDWLEKLTRKGRALSNGSISPTQWTSQTGLLYESVPMARLLEWIDIDALRRLTDAPGCRGEVFTEIFVGEPNSNGHLENQEPAKILIAHVARVEKGRSIPPHGHKNMVSAFLTVSGEFHVRQYDKIGERTDALIIRPSVDEHQTVGGWSAISDTRNNVHWLKAMSDECLLFTTKMIRLDEAAEYCGRINLDVDRATAYGGTLLAPKITNLEASERY